jgi:hypothetical protein
MARCWRSLILLSASVSICSLVGCNDPGCIRHSQCGGNQICVLGKCITPAEAGNKDGFRSEARTETSPRDASDASRERGPDGGLDARRDGWPDGLKREAGSADAKKEAKVVDALKEGLKGG